MSDVFNNSSNNYVYPALPPCVGDADQFNFKFLTKREAGIVSGAEALMTFDLSDIDVLVTTWLSQKKYIQPGEVVYVPGLTKGLVIRTQNFSIPDEVQSLEATYPDLKFWLQLDLSINYYYNFKYYNIGIDSSANAELNVDIDDAVNVNFGSNNVKAGVVHTSDLFTFTGNYEGFAFNVNNVVLTVIDSSMNEDSPIPADIDASTGIRIPQVYTLEEDTSSAIPSAKYPNGAMRGYLLKSYFPSDAESTAQWFYMYNVKSPFTYYAAIDASVNGETATVYEQLTKDVEVGMSGSGNATTISAPEFLDYINMNNMWGSVGDFKAHISAPDPADSNQLNLIGGFYIFNPQTFAIQVEYLLIN